VFTKKYFGGELTTALGRNAEGHWLSPVYLEGESEMGPELLTKLYGAF
jgi:hypothetical protein